VRIGQIDDGKRASAGVARARPRYGTLQQLHEDMRPGVGEEGRQAEARLSECDQREPGRERRPRAAEVRDPAHQAGTGVGPNTRANASASGRPS